MEKFLNYIMEILAFLLAILIFVFKDRLDIMVVVVSIFGILFGLCWILKKRPYGALVLGGGVSVLISFLLYKYKILIFSDSVTFAMCSCLIVSLVLSFLVDCYNRKKIMGIYSLIVEAEVVDLVKNPNSNKEMYVPIYSYSVDSEKYEVEYFKYIIKKIPSIGSKKFIRVNPNDHFDVVFEQEKKDMFFNLCCYIFLIIVSLLIIFRLF